MMNKATRSKADVEAHSADAYKSNPANPAHKATRDWNQNQGIGHGDKANQGGSQGGQGGQQGGQGSQQGGQGSKTGGTTQR